MLPSFTRKAFDLLCPKYQMTTHDCYPSVPLGIRLRELRANYNGIEYDVKYEYNNNVAFFFECVAKLYLNTPFDCQGFFHSLDDKMFAVLVTTIQNDETLIDRVFDYCSDDEMEVVAPVADVADEYTVVDMFSPEFEQEVQLEVQANVDLYLVEFQNSRAMPILSQDYSDHMDNYSAYAHRLPLIIEIVSQLPNDLIWAPGDGIGVVSLACLLLHREYWSSEPNRIGLRARELGIIKSGGTFEDFVKSDRDGIVIISNLARYCDMTLLQRYTKLIIIDELCYYPGCDVVPIVPGTYGRIRSNVPFRVTSGFFDGVNRIDKIFSINDSYVTEDSRAYVAMQRLGYNICAKAESPLSKLVPAGDGKLVTYNFVGVTSSSDLILTYRKRAGAQSGRPGQYQWFDGMLYRFNRDEYIRVKRRGYKLYSDRNYNSTSILYGVLPTYEPQTYILGFDPSKLRYARVAHLVVLIKIISVKRVKQKYECVIIRYDDHGKLKK